MRWISPKIDTSGIDPVWCLFYQLLPREQIALARQQEPFLVVLTISVGEK